ncbi:MAG: hypothetical protein IJY42_04430 [Clostridia bacterium]|nr:hypothetical protein [Clostridia bacterium]
MKRIFECLDGGSEQLQKKKKITVYSILVTMTAILLTLAILLVSSVVSAIRNNLPDNSETETEGNGTPAGFVSTSGLAADNHLLSLPYAGGEPTVVKIADHRASKDGDNAYSILGTDDLYADATALNAFNEMTLAFLAVAPDNLLYVCDAYRHNRPDADYAAGTSFSLSYSHEGNRDTTIYGVDTYAWLYSNAHKYGFIQLYSTEDVTVDGTVDRNKACIFRYVGIPHATYIYGQGQYKTYSLAEHLEALTKRAAGKALTLTDGYRAYYIAPGEAQLIPTAEQYDYTVSSNGSGGFIVTYKKK